MNWITELLRRPTVDWWDLVDVLVVSFLVYEVLKLIRGTRAVQMVVGGGMLFALFYGSQWSHLETLNWLIRNFAGYMVFAVIVLFQSDIRRALAHLGRAPFFRYLAKAESAEESIEEIAVAASMLSSQRIGALVAVERQIGLRNYIEGGIPLDAVMTYDLLLSIFQPTSPLHDGAVIVQDDRIAAAACFLPLTVNPKLSKELGSRHRAAIGLTEENDAVAVVVSEETGAISLVADGEIERGLDADDASCEAPFARRAGEPGEGRPLVAGAVHMTAIWPFRHFGLKLLSVGVAVLLWLVVAGEQTVERGLRVPLELQQFPEGPGARRRAALARRRPRARRVERAQPDFGRRPRGGARPACRAPGPPAVSAHAGAGAHTVRRAGAAGHARQHRPGVRELPVAARAGGAHHRGRAGPRLHRRTGDGRAADGGDCRTRKRGQARRPTRSPSPSRSNGARQQVTESVTVGLLDPMVRLKTAGQATVTVQVLPGPRERTVRDRPVHLRALSPSLTAQALPEVVSVVLRGSAEGIGRVQPDAVNAFVDLAGLGAGQYTLTVHVDPSPDAGIARVVPDTVQVRIASARN